VFYLEILALAGFIGYSEMSTQDTANEGEYQFIFVGFAIYPYQPFNNYLQTGFLLYFTDNGFCWHLAVFNAASGQVPKIKVSPVAQENPA